MAHRAILTFGYAVCTGRMTMEASRQDTCILFWPEGSEPIFTSFKPQLNDRVWAPLDAFAAVLAISP